MSALGKMLAFSETVARKAPLWTQGFGGNISAKETGTLFIKASGFRLGDVRGKTGWVGLTRGDLEKNLLALRAAPLEQVEERYAELLKDRRFVLEGSSHPSMETGFHALLPRKYVLHFHSLAAVLMSHREKLEDARISHWFSERGVAAEFIGPTSPGWGLARALADHPTPQVLILENHGVVLHSDEETALEDWRKVEHDFCREFGFPVLNELMQAGDPLLASRAWVGEHAVSPLKIYFPDTAVFLDKLESALQAKAGGFSLPEGVWQSDSNLAELWLATAILHRLCPELGEVPTSISASLAGMPAERMRRLVTEGPGENE